MRLSSRISYLHTLSGPATAKHSQKRDAATTMLQRGWCVCGLMSDRLSSLMLHIFIKQRNPLLVDFGVSSTLSFPWLPSCKALTDEEHLANSSQDGVQTKFELIYQQRSVKMLTSLTSIYNKTELRPKGKKPNSCFRAKMFNSQVFQQVSYKGLRVLSFGLDFINLVACFTGDLATLIQTHAHIMS